MHLLDFKDNSFDERYQTSTVDIKI